MAQFLPKVDQKVAQYLPKVAQKVAPEVSFKSNVYQKSPKSYQIFKVIFIKKLSQDFSDIDHSGHTVPILRTSCPAIFQLWRVCLFLSLLAFSELLWTASIWWPWKIDFKFFPIIFYENSKFNLFYFCFGKTHLWNNA